MYVLCSMLSGDCDTARRGRPSTLSLDGPPEAQPPPIDFHIHFIRSPEGFFGWFQEEQYKEYQRSLK
jgi:hypothetical protein